MLSTRRLVFLVVLAAYVLGLSSALWVAWPLAVIIASLAFFATYLTIAFVSLDRLDEAYLRHAAVKSDVPVFMIHLITLGTVATSFVALFQILNAEHAVHYGQVAVAVAALPMGWATIHMMSAFHYAHLFWRNGPDGTPHLGLAFPGGKDPDGWDFVYFSFVIGLAAQTADVAITSRPMRRFALVHSIVAYFFNAVLIAAGVNVVLSAT